jgi:hypothetical protein
MSAADDPDLKNKPASVADEKQKLCAHIRVVLSNIKTIRISGGPAGHGDGGGR